MPVQRRGSEKGSAEEDGDPMQRSGSGDGPGKAIKDRIKVTAMIKGERREVVLPLGGDVAALLRALGLPLITHIVIKGAYPIPTDEVLEDGDEIVLLETFSGG